MKGVMVVVHFPSGRVAGTGTDFEPGAPAGMRVEEVQERRARMYAWVDVFRQTCHDDVATALASRDLEARGVAHWLRNHRGWIENVIQVDTGASGEDPE